MRPLLTAANASGAPGIASSAAIAATAMLFTTLSARNFFFSGPALISSIFFVGLLLVTHRDEVVVNEVGSAGQKDETKAIVGCQQRTVDST